MRHTQSSGALAWSKRIQFEIFHGCLNHSLHCSTGCALFMMFYSQLNALPRVLIFGGGVGRSKLPRGMLGGSVHEEKKKEGQLSLDFLVGCQSHSESC